MNPFLDEKAEYVWSPRDRKGRRIIQGIASTSTLNSHKYSLRAEGCDIRLPIPVLWRHDSKVQVGEVTCVAKSVHGIGVVCEIFHTPEANIVWNEIVSGRARCFSGAADQKNFSHPVKFPDGKSIYCRWQLAEVSVCPQGANPDCTFSILRNADKEPREPVKLITLPKGCVRIAR